MTTQEAPPRLTGKQQQVLDLLEAGVNVTEIAKRLGIGESGVYGHMRNIRKRGITLPDERVGETPAPVVPAVASSNGNGRVDPASALQAAIAADEARLQEIKREVADMETERRDIDARKAKYSAALKALG